MPTKTKTTITTASVSRSLASLLGVDDTNRATLAVLVAASEEIEQNSRFAARIRAMYDVLPASKSTRSPAASKQSDIDKILSSTLKPIRHVESVEINLAAALDPYFLLEVYGPDQLREALDLFPLTRLKEGLPAVMERNPGTKPKNKSSKAAIVDYIVQHVTDAERPVQ